MFGKRGKYEAVPTEAAVKYKKKSVKSNLLSAYFTSLLCLVLCATMFMSTSMAWFTSEVNNGGNEIYVGTLDVKLLHGGKEVIPNSDPVYAADYVWAPDSLQLDEFTIESEGTLGFSYRMSMNISYEGYTTEEKELAEKAASEITVWVKEGSVAGDTVFADITEENKWTAIGTLADVLNGATIVSGKMDPVVTATVASDEAVTSRTFTVALHMDTDASAEIMGAKLSNMTIKLVAAQTASVNVVFNEQELKDAMAKGGNVLLMNDITVDADQGGVSVPVGVTTNLYLNGYTISGVGDEAAATAVITNSGVLTIYDGAETGTIELLAAQVDPNNGYATNTITNNGVLIVNSGTIRNNLSNASYAIDNNSGATATINGGNVINTQGTAIRAYSWSETSASTLVINGGTVTGTYAVRVNNLHSANACKISVTVNGGTLVATGEYNMALYSMCNDGSNVSITLNGGTYYGDIALGGGTKTAPETFSWTEENCTVYGDIYSYNTSVQADNDNYYYKNPDEYVIANSAEELIKAVESAEDGVVIFCMEDMVCDLTVTQAAEVAFTIDGNGHTLTGALVVDGKSERYDTAGVTIKNINFVADSISTDACINLGVEGDNNTRYTNHVTVENCTFDVPGAVAVKSYTGGDKNLTIKGCFVSDRCHSLLQVTNVEEGLKITDCQVYSKNGANLNNTPSLEMSGCTFDVKGYAIRFGVAGSVNADQKKFKITDSNLKSSCAESDDAVIVIRDNASNAKLTLVNTTLEGKVKVVGNTVDTIIEGLN